MQYLKIPGLDISERKKRRKKKCLKIPGFNISENAVNMRAALLVLAFGAAVALDDHGGSLGDFLLFYSFIYGFFCLFFYI